MLLAFVGPPALSSLRRRSLLARCQSCAPEVEDLTVTYFYAVQCARALSDDEMARLMRILDVDAALPARAHNEVAIGPRPGTTSPWSSKATDILRNCGLEFVRRVERGTLYAFAADTVPSAVLPLLYDRMIEAPLDSLETLFRRVDPKPLVHIPVRAEGRGALVAANREMGLALSDEEIDYALHAFAGRDLTDVELMMFAVVNSEHCRHKIFNADWIIDGQRETRSLFDMIRHTHAAHPQGTVKAYSDNAGVIEGFDVPIFGPQLDEDFRYGYRQRQTHVLIKVETHNHPTAIAPYPGASTGVGGEIRDEGAAGTGGWSQAGLCAFFTSHLRVPGFAQPWEIARPAGPVRCRPQHVDPLQKRQQPHELHDREHRPQHPVEIRRPSPVAEAHRHRRIALKERRPSRLQHARQRDQHHRDQERDQRPRHRRGVKLVLVVFEQPQAPLEERDQRQQVADHRKKQIKRAFEVRDRLDQRLSDSAHLSSALSFAVPETRVTGGLRGDGSVAPTTFALPPGGLSNTTASSASRGIRIVGPVGASCSRMSPADRAASPSPL